MIQYLIEKYTLFIQERINDINFTYTENAFNCCTEKIASAQDLYLRFIDSQILKSLNF